MEYSIAHSELLIAALIAVAFIIIASMVFLRKIPDSGSAPPPAQRHEIERLRADLIEVRRRLDRLEARSAPADSDGEDEGRPAYDYAVQYAHQGMTAQDIAARCGISRDEATLIVAMHRKSATL